MKHLRLTVILLSFLCLTIQLSGCAALLLGGAAGAGSVVYVKGQLKDTMRAPVTTVHTASIAALKELGLPVIEDNHDSLSAKIKSRFADGQDVWIDIEYGTVESSRITIRVGIVGDEVKSRQILDSIKQHLTGAGRRP